MVCSVELYNYDFPVVGDLELGNIGTGKKLEINVKTNNLFKVKDSFESLMKALIDSPPYMNINLCI